MRTINHAHEAARVVLQRAVKKRLVPFNPDKDADPPRYSTAEREYATLSAEEIGRFFGAAAELGGRFEALFVELPDELNERFYGDEEPMQPYVGQQYGSIVDSIAFPRSMSSSTYFSQSVTFGARPSGPSPDADGFLGYPEPVVKNYTEWRPSMDPGTKVKDPGQLPYTPWQPGDPQATDPQSTDPKVSGPQAADPTSESTRRLSDTSGWAYVALAALCLTALALPLVLRPVRRNEE